MNTLQKIELLRRQLDARTSFDIHSNNESIAALLSEIINDMSSLSYQEASNCRLALFDVFDQHQALSLGLLLLLLHRSLSLIVNLHVTDTNSTFNCENDIDSATNSIFEYMKEQVPHGTAFRFSNHPLPDAQIPENLRECILFYLPFIIESTQDGLLWTLDDFEAVLILLTLARQAALGADQLEYVYRISMIAIDRLNISSLNQLARDFAEEILLAGIADTKRDWAYLIMSKAYIGQRNILEGVLYLNTAVKCSLKNSAISSLLLNNILFVVLIIYRDLLIPEWAESQLNSMMYHLKLNRMDLLYIKSIHLDTLLFSKHPAAITRFYNHLNENREAILEAGISYTVSILSRIYALRNLFPGHPDLDLLTQYEKFFENIANPKDYKNTRAIALGQTEGLDDAYLDILTSLERTRSSGDIPYEVHSGIIAADRLVRYAYSSQNIDRFMRAAILKADYSLSFKSQSGFEPGTTIPLTYYRTILPQSATVNYKTYANYLRSESSLPENACVLCLLESDRMLYYVTLDILGYSPIQKCSEWTIDTMRSWLGNKFEIMNFENEQYNRNSTLPYSRVDQLDSLNEIASQLQFAKIAIPDRRLILVIKDSAIGGFPHNLLLCEDGTFALIRHTIVGILSMEWYLSSLERFRDLEGRPRVHFWIPIHGGDMALNALWSQLEPRIADRIEHLDLEISPKRPLAGDINIVCAHGSDDIATFHALFMDQNTATTDVDKIIGMGSILILFVCHSGSMTDAMLKHQVQSMARRYLNRGYQAIVAPYWALDISIPPIWLPHFIDAFDSGATVAKAAFQACQRVHTENAHPGAWACLHLYGNPELKIAENLQ